MTITSTSPFDSVQINLCFTDGLTQTGRQDRNLADFIIIINKLSNFYLYRATKTTQKIKSK